MSVLVRPPWECCGQNEVERFITRSTRHDVGQIHTCPVARIAATSRDDAFDIGNLTAKGLGPFAGKVRMAGLRGGGLPICTADGWGLQRRPLAWPDDELILSPPGQTMLWTPRDQPMQLTRLAGFAEEVRAFGFSPTGGTFIIATASDLAIFAR